MKTETIIYFFDSILKLKGVKKSSVSFLKNSIKLCNVKNHVLLSSLIYLKYLRDKIEITDYTKDSILIGLMIISSKFWNDVPLQNSYWVKVSGFMSPNDANIIEKYLLEKLEYKLYIPEKTYKFLLNCINDWKEAVDNEGKLCD